MLGALTSQAQFLPCKLIQSASLGLPVQAVNANAVDRLLLYEEYLKFSSLLQKRTKCGESKPQDKSPYQTPATAVPSEIDFSPS